MTRLRLTMALAHYDRHVPSKEETLPFAPLAGVDT